MRLHWSDEIFWCLLGWYLFCIYTKRAWSDNWISPTIYKCEILTELLKFVKIVSRDIKYIIIHSWNFLNTIECASFCARTECLIGTILYEGITFGEIRNGLPLNPSPGFDQSECRRRCAEQNSPYEEKTIPYDITNTPY